MSEKDIYLSVVLPVHNEEGSIDELHRRLTSVCKSLDKPYEIVYVENRSTDGTVAKLKGLKGAKVIILRLAMMGSRTTQSVALDAGIKAAKGELIVTMDSDLQNPPEEIPRMIDMLIEQDLDVLSGWRKKRRDSIIIRTVSKIGSALRKKILNPGVHDLGCTLKVYRRECFDGVDLYGELHRYLVAILRWRGFKVGETVVKHAERTSGNSSYNWKKIFRGFVDMWQVWFWKKYSDRPLHLFGVTGVFMMLVGIASLGILGLMRLFFAYSLVNSILPLIAILLIITGLQLFVFGMVIDLMIRYQISAGREQTYLIKEIIEV